jgi:hypothetical protein
MEITRITPVAYGGPGPTITLANFSVAISPALTLTGYRLRQKPDGSHAVVPPKAFGVSTAHLSPTLSSQIAEVAAAAYRSQLARDHAQP